MEKISKAFLYLLVFLLYIPYFSITFVFMDRIMHTETISIPIKVYMLIFYSVIWTICLLIHIAFLWQSLEGITHSSNKVEKSTEYLEMSTNFDREETKSQQNRKENGCSLKATVRYMIMETITTTICGVILCFWSANIYVHGFLPMKGFISQKTQYSVLLFSWLICLGRIPIQRFLVARNPPLSSPIKSRISQYQESAMFSEFL